MNVDIIGTQKWPNFAGGTSYKQYKITPTGKWIVEFDGDECHLYIEAIYKTYFREIKTMFHETDIIIRYFNP